jgi:hypothetical protein
MILGQPLPERIIANESLDQRWGVRPCRGYLDLISLSKNQFNRAVREGAGCRFRHQIISDSPGCV